MNNDNNIQNNSMNSVNNQQVPVAPTADMFSFGVPSANTVGTQNIQTSAGGMANVTQTNNVYEVPSVPVNNMQAPIQEQMPQSIPQVDANSSGMVNVVQTNNVYEVPSVPANNMQAPMQEQMPQSIPQVDANINGMANVTQTNNVYEVPSAPIVDNVIQSEPVVEEITLNQEINPSSEIPLMTDMSMPEIAPEQIVLDNSRKKETSDLPIIIIIIVMIIGVVFLDDIIAFVKDNILTTSPSSISSANSDNLFNGYIKVGEPTSGISFEEIRFYGFTKKQDSFSVVLNYLSQSNLKDIEKDGYYIELYNSNKDVLYKELFVVDGVINKGEVSTYSISLDSNVFDEVFYALVKVYSESALNVETTLSCRYKSSNPGFNELYKHDFVFKNDMLVSYSVDKSLDIADNNASATKAKNDIQAEYEKLNVLDLPATYTDTSLVYSINFDNLTSSYIPLYKKGTTSFVIKEREKYLKWECE